MYILCKYPCIPNTFCIQSYVHWIMARRNSIFFQAGLAAITTGELTYAMIRNDPEAVGVLLAAQAPHWPPGERFGYHALSFGLYIDQLVRRIDPHHRSLDQFFQEEVAVPFGQSLRLYFLKETRLFWLHSTLPSVLWQLREHPQSSAKTNLGRSLRSQGTGALDPKYTILLGDMIVS